MKIVLDTNFLIANLKWKVGVFRSLRGEKVYIIPQVVKELEMLGKGKGETGKFARLALRQMREKGLKTLNTKGSSADSVMFSLAKKGYVIATQDKILRQRIQRARGKTILIRQKKYVSEGW